MIELEKFIYNLSHKNSNVLKRLCCLLLPKIVKKWYTKAFISNKASKQKNIGMYSAKSWMKLNKINFES
jgi:hypothetical protein